MPRLGRSYRHRSSRSRPSRRFLYSRNFGLLTYRLSRLSGIAAGNGYSISWQPSSVAMRDTGKHLIREYGLLISKKNTKPTIAAGIMRTALILRWREEEEHLILAPTKEVADNSFKLIPTVPSALLSADGADAAELVRIDDYLLAVRARPGWSRKGVRPCPTTSPGTRARRLSLLVSRGIPRRPPDGSWAWHRANAQTKKALEGKSRASPSAGSP